ncbi:MAG: Mov34/MPN/PAD-1 family protein [Bernardetiaceae bacterium]
MSRFKIKVVTPAYRPKAQPEPALKPQPQLAAAQDKHANKQCKLWLSPQSITQIFTHIGWGTQTKHNQVEQGGILIGEVGQDPQTGVQYAIVRQAIAGSAARGTSAYLEMDHGVWKEMMDRADELIDDRPEDDPWHIIGWYHTHPNDLSVFFSATDLATQHKFFYEDWQYALVFNPHKKIWKAFYGKSAKPCLGFVMAQ